MAEIWLIILLAGLLTYATRLSFIATAGRWQPPGWFLRALRYVPPAVLSAIILPEMLVRDGQVIVPWTNPRLLAGLLAVFIAWRTRNAFMTILAGMLALYAAQYLIGRVV